MHSNKFSTNIGGVGKSTVCGQIAYSLADHYENTDKQVYNLKSNSISSINLILFFFFLLKIGVLDVDICGPSLPLIFGVQNEQV